MDFIELKSSFDDCCYHVGSSKLMDFCLKVGSEVETLLREILNGSKLDSSDKIDEARNNQNIDRYREYIEPVYKLSDYKLDFMPMSLEICPFEEFQFNQNPGWFKVYSKHKHNKLELIKIWNMEHSLYALGGFLLLVINHPSLELGLFNKNSLSQKLFDLYDIEPRFVGIVSSVEFGKRF